MKKLLFFILTFFVLTDFVKAQTPVVPQFKRHIPADSLLGYSIPGVAGNHWLPDTAWVKKHAVVPYTYFDSVVFKNDGSFGRPFTLNLFHNGPFDSVFVFHGDTLKKVPASAVGGSNLGNSDLTSTGNRTFEGLNYSLSFSSNSDNNTIALSSTTANIDLFNPSGGTNSGLDMSFGSVNLTAGLGGSSGSGEFLLNQGAFTNALMDVVSSGKVARIGIYKSGIIHTDSIARRGDRYSQSYWNIGHLDSLYIPSQKDVIHLIDSLASGAITGFVPTTRTLTINGTALDLSANRSWNVGNALTANPLSQFAATTSAQLAGVLSDETGSGAAVFGTSPTLTTPNLGTPSALVGTNITGTGSGFTAGNINGTTNGTIVTLSALSLPYSQVTGTPTIPTAANPSGLLTFTEANGSNTTYERNDGLHAIDSTVVRSVANSRTLAQEQTALNLKVDKTTTVAGFTLSGNITLAALSAGTGLTFSNYTGAGAITAKADTTVLQTVITGITRTATTTTLQSYAGTATVVNVIATDGTGGVFTYVSSGLTADGGTIFAATGKGSGYWKRQYNPADGIRVSWWGDTFSYISSAITCAGVNGKVIFTPNKTYLQTLPLVPLAGQVWIGNNATLQRQTETVVTISGSILSSASSFTVSSVPATWHVGDQIQLFVSQSTIGASTILFISNISGNVITVTGTVGVGLVNGATSYASPSIWKVWNQIDNSSTFCNFDMYNLTMDGNQTTSCPNVYWGANIAVYAHAQLIHIINCSFINMGSDNIQGHGYYITGCCANNLNNGFIHLSADITHSPLLLPSQIFSNRFYNTNQILSSTGSGHSEGVITLSASGGFAEIYDNWVNDTNTANKSLDAFIGTLSMATSGSVSGASRFLKVHDNHVFNCARGLLSNIVADATETIKPGQVQFYNNHLDNCGSTSPFPATLNASWAYIDKITWYGNTYSNSTSITAPAEVYPIDIIANTNGTANIQTGASIDIDGTVIAAGASFGSQNRTALVYINSSLGTAPSNTTSEPFAIESSTTAGVGVGPSMLFRGQTNNTSTSYAFAGIQGYKAVSGAGDYTGGLGLYTQNAGGSTNLTNNLTLLGTGFNGFNTTTSGSALQVNGGLAVGYSSATAAPSNGLQINGQANLLGDVYGQNFYNKSNGAGGSALQLNNNNVVLSHSTADANTVLIVNNIQSGATGKIADFQFASSSVANIDKTGKFTVANVLNSGLTASKVVFTDASKNETSTGIGTSSQGIAGDGSLFTLNSKPHTIFTPTTGGTVNLTNNQYNIINPSGALLALTVALPSSPANNDCVFIKFTQNVTTVTYSNGTVVDGITAPTAGGLTVLTYDSGTTSWY